MFKYSAEIGLEQFIVNHQAEAYMRGWYQPSPGGAAVDIVALSFRDSSYPSRVMAAYKVLSTRNRNVPFNVPGITASMGYVQPPEGSAAPTPESIVMFSKGKTLDLVVVAAQSGKSDAIKVAKAQANNGTSHSRHHG